MNQGALAGFDYGMGQAKPHAKRHLLPIGMQQFTEEALIACLKVSTLLEIFDEDQGNLFL